MTRVRGIVAGLEPAQRNGELATLAGGLAHDVSILLGIGRHFGLQPVNADRKMTPIGVVGTPSGH